MADPGPVVVSEEVPEYLFKLEPGQSWGPGRAEKERGRGTVSTVSPESATSREPARRRGGVQQHVVETLLVEEFPAA